MGKICCRLLIPINCWHVAHPAGDAGEGDVVVAGTQRGSASKKACIKKIFIWPLMLPSPKKDKVHVTITM